MKSLKQNIEEIASAVKSRLLNGDYEVVEVGMHTATVLVESIEIELWIANTPADDFRWYLDPFSKSIFEGKANFSTTDERLQAYRMFCQKAQPSISHKEKAIKSKITALNQELSLIQQQKECALFNHN